LTRYLNFYNHERPHQALDYRIPAEVYFGALSSQDRQHNPILKGAEPTLKTVTFLS
jgi:hypothetical protein